jgi:hypothetical protein
MAFTLDSFRDAMKTRRGDFSNTPKCEECGKPLQETLTGNRKISKGFVCSDCYFDLLGKEIDEHPILIHRPVHGT